MVLPTPNKNQDSRESLSQSFERMPELKRTPDVELLPAKEREKTADEIAAERAEAQLNLAGPLISKNDEPKTSHIATTKSIRLRKIETILEEDLDDVYFNLDPKTKEVFKQKGEETALKIDRVLSKARFKAKEIFKLIIDWLKIVPGVDKFFLRQEAKIKASKIMNIKE